MRNGDQDELVADGEENSGSGGDKIRGRGASPGEDALTAPQGDRLRGGNIAMLIRGPAEGLGAREGCTSGVGIRATTKRQAQGQTYDDPEASQHTEVHGRIGSERQCLAAPHIVSTDGDTELGASPPLPKSKEDYKIHFAAVELHGSTCTVDHTISSSMGCNALDDMRLGEGRASGSDAMEEVDDARSHAAADWAWHGRDSQYMAGAVTRPSESAR